MSAKELSVRLHGQPVGLLRQNNFGKLEFSYLDSGKMISAYLPFEPGRVFSHKVAAPFFEGLLPEGEVARQALKKRFGISNNTFSLLGEIGRECAGAISIVDVNESVNLAPIPLEGRVFSEAELALHIRELPKKPLFIGVDDLRLSLAGAQNKAAICLIDGEIAIPEKNSVSTHILKPEIQGYDGSVQNEYFCMRLAARLGFNVPKVNIAEAEGLLYLLIERYDRRLEPNGMITRIHQEDFCQALGVLPVSKYENDGGPSLQSCFKLVKQSLNPASSVLSLVSRILFNYLIGNCDAHGKNFSILHHEQGFSLAPVYDVMSTTVYPEISTKMAMQLGGHYKRNEILPRHWKHLLVQVSFSEPQFLNILRKLLQQIISAAEIEYRLMQQAEHKMEVVDLVVEEIEKQVKKTKMQFGIS